MKTLLSVFCCLLCGLAVLAIPPGILKQQMIAPASGGSITYLLNEGFEGGVRPAGWTDGILTSDGTAEVYNYSPALVGNYSLHIGPAGGGFNYSTGPWTPAQSSVHSRCLIWFTEASGDISQIGEVNIQDVAGAHVLMAAKVYSSAGNYDVALNCNGADTVSSQNISLNTVYYVWLDWVNGGTCTLAMSTSSTKPSSDSGGNIYLTATGAAYDASEFTCFGQSSACDFLIDDIKVSTSVIP